MSDIEAIEAELAAYTPTLQGGRRWGTAPRLIVLNKIDVPDARELAEIVRHELASAAGRCTRSRPVTRNGLRELTFAHGRAGARVPRRAAGRRADAHRDAAHRRSTTRGFTVEHPDGEGGFVVRGARPERWIRQTDFTNDEAVGYLADRLARLGVEDELLKRVPSRAAR